MLPVPLPLFHSSCIQSSYLSVAQASGKNKLLHRLVNTRKTFLVLMNRNEVCVKWFTAAQWCNSCLRKEVCTVWNYAEGNDTKCTCTTLTCNRVFPELPDLTDLAFLCFSLNIIFLVISWHVSSFDTYY